MHSRFMKLGSLFLTGALASSGAAAHADITTSGVVCNNFNAGEAQDIDYLFNGVRNVNAAPRAVICGVPIEPIPAGNFLEVFINGTNVGGTTTQCIFTVSHFNGAIFEFIILPEGSGTDWDHSAGFPLNSIVSSDRAALWCLLPGSAAGIFFGVSTFNFVEGV